MTRLNGFLNFVVIYDDYGSAYHRHPVPQPRKERIGGTEGAEKPSGDRFEAGPSRPAASGETLGAGEILLNCIDRDGTNQGFDMELINAVKAAVGIPAIASSGAACAGYFLDVFTRTNADAALAAGPFHRREVPISEVKVHLSGKVAVRL